MLVAFEAKLAQVTSAAEQALIDDPFDVLHPAASAVRPFVILKPQLPSLQIPVNEQHRVLEV